MSSTGTGGFTQLADESGELWAQFGVDSRSTFMFVNDDGTFESSGFGSVDEAELERRVQALIDS